MRAFLSYHLRLIGCFCASRWMLVVPAAVVLAALPTFSYGFAVMMASSIGVSVTRADVFVMALSSDQQADVGWIVAPIVALAVVSVLLRQFYTDNFVLRWRTRRRARAGEALDTLIISLAAGLILFVGALVLAAALGLDASNFADPHSLLTRYLGRAAPHEPSPLSFLAFMLPYGLLAVALVGQLFLLVRKALRNDTMCLVLLFIVGAFHLDDMKFVLMLFNLPQSLTSQIASPFALVYSMGQVGYSSWLAPSLHGLPAMAAVLAVLFALNVVVASRRGPRESVRARGA